MATARPDIDVELASALAGYSLPSVLSREILPEVQAQMKLVHTVEAALGNEDLFTHEERAAVGIDGNEIPLAIFSPTPGRQTSTAPKRPCIYFLHAGGLIYNNRFAGVAGPLTAANGVGAVVVSADYRLAPEARAPAAVEDSYAGLLWVFENAEALGIDTNRVLLWGSSAGGGLGVAVGMMVRDRQPAGVKLAGLLLNAPMLDSNVDETEGKIFSGDAAPIWSSETHALAWEWYLGDSPEAAANPYHVPARATDLTNLPPVFIDVGTTDLFRKAATRFAEKLWETGAHVELHVWPGAPHGFEIFAPTAELSKKAQAARSAWAQKILSL